MVMLSEVTPTSVFAVPPVVPWLMSHAMPMRRAAVVTARDRHRRPPYVIFFLLVALMAQRPLPASRGASKFTDTTLGQSDRQVASRLAVQAGADVAPGGQAAHP